RTVPSANRVVRRNARIGTDTCRVSSVPEHTLNKSGVMTKKLSRLMRTTSTSGRRRKSFSRWRAVWAPPNPPPRITIRVLGADGPAPRDLETGSAWAVSFTALFLLPERDRRCRTSAADGPDILEAANSLGGAPAKGRYPPARPGRSHRSAVALETTLA